MKVFVAFVVGRAKDRQIFSLSYSSPIKRALIIFKVTNQIRQKSRPFIFKNMDPKSLQIKLCSSLDMYENFNFS